MTAFAHLLPEKQPHPLKKLWIEAAEASEALGQYYALPMPNEYEIDRLEASAHQAEQALRTYLLVECGLTTADLKRGVFK